MEHITFIVDDDINTLGESIHNTKKNTEDLVRRPV
jgi:hypothetical protein